MHLLWYHNPGGHLIFLRLAINIFKVCIIAFFSYCNVSALSTFQGPPSQDALQSHSLQDYILVFTTLDLIEFFNLPTSELTKIDWDCSLCVIFCIQCVENKPRPYRMLILFKTPSWQTSVDSFFFASPLVCNFLRCSMWITFTIF